MTTEEKIQAAKVRVSRNHPYLMVALLAMHFRPNPDVPTMGVDKRWNCYYNPEKVAKWSVEEIASVFEHELWHLLRRHADRSPKCGPNGENYSTDSINRLWNVATDCEINDDLMSDGLNSLPECVHPKNYEMPDGLTAEEYYASGKCGQIYKVDKSWSGQKQEQTSEEGEDSEKKDEGSGTGSNKNNGNKGQQSTSYGGSCADGQDREWEVVALGSKPQEHLSPLEKEIIYKSVAKSIKEGQNQGNIPAGYQRWADDTLRDPVVQWSRELGATIKGHLASLSGLGDITYGRPHRRSAVFFPFIRPAPYRLIPSIAIVIDTSGSVGDEMLSQFLTEVHNILKKNDNIGVTVLSCDAAVHSVKKIFNRKQVDLVGAGGTDMGEGLKKAAELNPHIIILMTDGYTDYPKEPPKSGIRYITVVMCEDGNVPTFGKVIKITSQTK